MTNDTVQPETSQDAHTYKYKPWMRILSITYLIIALVVIGGPLVGFIAISISIDASEPAYRMLSMWILIVTIPLILLFGLLIFQIITSIIQSFTSYIRVTPEGIENKIWLSRHIRSRWSEVDRLGKFFLFDNLYLKSYEMMNRSLPYTWTLKIFQFFQSSIPLSGFNGWPHGQLADDLKHYLPQLFENRPRAEKASAQAYDQHRTAISQDHRLLAAFSHASILVSGIGVFVPIVIYATQKKKSTYLAFQSLQAFFFQLMMNLIVWLFPIFIISIVLITTFTTAFSGNENALDQYGLVIMIATGAATILMILGAVGFSIYGIIGAITTYQGKNFHYAIIGKWVEKRSHPGGPANIA